jgi:hypothetical protein
MKRRIASFVFSAALLVLAVAMGCSGSKNRNSAFVVDSGLIPGQPSSDASAGDAGPSFGGDGAGSDAPVGCSTHCSSDLHSVLDCNGNVVTMCPPDQGCSGTTCVAACDSATANKSTIGCDYYAVTPDVIVPAPGACFAAFIANTWTTPVTLTVEYGSQTLDPKTFAYIPSGTGMGTTYALLPGGQIPAGKVAIVFLDANPMTDPGAGLNFACPSGVNAAMMTDSAAHGTAIGTAFHIGTSAPVVAYDIFPYGGGQSAVTSATLLLPTSAWDTNYVAVDAFAGGPASVSMGQPFIEFVAQQDGTTITIDPTADIQAGSGSPAVKATSMGVPATYNLNKGQVLQFTQDEELEGSVVQSNHPIGAWGGITCLNIDLQTCCCDSAHQQIPPIKALGNEYVAVRYRNRFQGMEETPPWRIVGAVNGTVLSYQPAAPSGAPVSLSRGQSIQFNAAGPFVVKSQDSQHPFYMSAHMSGADTVNPDESDGRGDPEFVNVIPPLEYLNSYVFFTDPTYPETDLVLVRTKGTNGFQDVKLDCQAGPVTGWQPAGSSGDYEYARVDLVTGNFQAQGSCNNGRHQITSKNPFGLTVWGWGSAATGDGLISGINTQYVSYAYPAGASVQPINTVVVPPTPQ